MKIVIDPKGNKHHWKKGDLHTSFGMVKEKQIKNGIIKTHLGEKLIAYEARFIDKLEKIKRGPAIITKKDIGTIIAYTGINEKTKIVDAGTGCGVLTAFLARISKNVTSYEKNKDFFNIAKNNLKFLKVKAKLKNKDIYQGITEKNLDLITLDLLEPWKVILYAKKSLKSGGFLVCYLTNIKQVIELIDNLNDFHIEKILETIERKWETEGLRIRPKNKGLLHTGFLLFARKISVDRQVQRWAEI